MTGRVLQVRPFAGGFCVFADDASDVSEPTGSRDDAVRQAKGLARVLGSAQIEIYAPNGSLERELWYQTSTSGSREARARRASARRSMDVPPGAPQSNQRTRLSEIAVTKR